MKEPNLDQYTGAGIGHQTQQVQPIIKQKHDNLMQIILLGNVNWIQGSSIVARSIHDYRISLWAQKSLGGM